MYTSLRTAWRIFAPAMRGVSSIKKAFGVECSRKEFEHFSKVPFSAHVLQGCRNTHLLFPGFPLSLLDLKERCPGLLPQAPYRDEPFAEQKVDLRWYLVRKWPHPGSLNKIFAEQTARISEHDEVPRTCEVVYGRLLHFVSTGERLGEWVRCRDKTSDGNHVIVGSCDANGLDVVMDWDDDEPSERIGLAVAWKPDLAS